MRLIVAEKPSVAWDIAKALGHPTKHEAHLTVGDDTITWAFGHLITLADPEHYDADWKHWSWVSLPMIPERFELQPIAKTRAHLKQVLTLMRSAQRLVGATDPDREGTLIWRYLWTLADVKVPVDRLWVTENTPNGIRKALANMKPDRTYDALAQAAHARAQADWLIGLNATRAFSLRHGQPGQPLSVGRVQTPTLRLIVDRDRAIDTFTPTPYWHLQVTFSAPAGSYAGIWQGPTKEHPARILDGPTAKSLAARVPPGTPGSITDLDTKTVNVSAPLFYNLSDLQREAHRRLHLTAQQTLDAAQRLYDAHLLSYPRTDARTITAEIAHTLAARLRAVTAGTPELRQQAAQRLTPQALGRLINEAQVAKAGHYAIMPTDQAAPASRTGTDRAVYDLVCRRFLAALLPAGQDARTTIWTTAAGERFRTTGTTVLSLGWRAALEPLPADPDAADEDSEPDRTIPTGLRQGDTVTVDQTDLKGKETKPPARLNDASLLGLLEKHGLGTPATRARIIEVLITRGYAERRKKTLQSTEKGRQLLRVVPDFVQSPDMTGRWEVRLEAIAEGSADARTFLSDIRDLARELVNTARYQEVVSILGNALGPCPLCHQGEIRATQKGWGCSRYRDGCAFMVWREISGKRLSEAQVKTLLAGKTTALLKGFKSRKTGKTFSARLKLDGPDAKVTFVFDAKPPRAS